jgi:hypothetical protein
VRVLRELPGGAREGLDNASLVLLEGSNSRSAMRVTTMPARGFFFFGFYFFAEESFG